MLPMFPVAQLGGACEAELTSGTKWSELTNLRGAHANTNLRGAHLKGEAECKIILQHPAGIKTHE
jgi:hypothetical protein